MDDPDDGYVSQQTSADEASTTLERVRQPKARAANKKKHVQKKCKHRGSSHTISSSLKHCNASNDNDAMSSHETSVSEESARIARAPEHWTKLESGVGKKRTQLVDTYDAIQTMNISRASGPEPQSSGLFHFADYLLTSIVNIDELSKLAKPSLRTYTFAELCWYRYSHHVFRSFEKSCSKASWIGFAGSLLVLHGMF